MPPSAFEWGGAQIDIYDSSDPLNKRLPTHNGEVGNDLCYDHSFREREREEKSLPECTMSMQNL